MKSNSTQAGRERIRKLAFDALAEYPDGQIPPSAEIGDLFPESARSGRAADRKYAEDALELLRASFAEAPALDREISPGALAGLESHRLMKSAARLGLYEILRNNAAPDAVYRELLGLFKSRADRLARGSEKGAELKESAESLLFEVFFQRFQYYVWTGLEIAGDSPSLTPQLYRKWISALGLDGESQPPEAAKRLVESVLLHKDILDSFLLKLCRPKLWRELPPSLRNVLRMGLMEVLTAMATPRAAAASLTVLLGAISADADEKERVEKFLQTQLEKSARSVGRAMAFQIIYSLAFTDIRSLEALREAYALSPYNISGQAGSSAAGVYSWILVRGVWEHAKALDEIIDRHSHNWRVERMGKIEITLLRLGLYEMIYERVPARIVISEIMDIADLYGAEAAKSLVNGIMDAVSKSDQLRLAEKRAEG